MTMLFSLAGCVDQSQGKESSDSGTKTESSADTSSESAESLLKITDPKEKAAVEAAKKKVQELDGEPRIIATSPATADICDKLELDLVGVCSSTVSTIPDRYKDVETVGTAMSPDTDQEFLTVNTEDMKTKEPDIILRAAHALPDQVVEMFNKDFAENDIWQHFDAVKNGRVYDLTYEYFGMSATFKYPQALEELQPILYPESDEDTQKAKEASDNAQKKAKDSDATEKYNEQQSK